MLKLFKNKSLKKTQKTKQGANNKNAKKQRGRSMVEMLGVLAIIGVLSIGGIQGYTMAMRKYRANEILDLVNKYAVMVYTSCQQQAISNPLKFKEDGTHMTHEFGEGGVLNVDAGAGIFYSHYKDMYFWQCFSIDFSDSGLGPLPKGVKKMGQLTFQSSYVSDNGLDGISIRSLSSGDLVRVPILLDDKDLCETVYSMTVNDQDKAEVSYCDSGMDGYLLTTITVINN